MFFEDQILPSPRSFALDFSNIEYGFFCKANCRCSGRKALIFPISGKVGFGVFLVYKRMLEMISTGTKD